MSLTIYLRLALFGGINVLVQGQCRMAVCIELGLGGWNAVHGTPVPRHVINA